MALARVKVWVPGEILTAIDLNGEFNNILNNPTALISPFTANLNANGKQITNLALENLGASPGAASAGRIWFNTATSVKQVEIDDGVSIRSVPTVLATAMTPGDLLIAVAGTSGAGNPSWARLSGVTSSQAGGVPLVQTTAAPVWGTSRSLAWITFSGVTTSSTVTPMDGAGVSTAINSIVKNSSGNYTITWTVPFASSGYAVTAMGQQRAGVSSIIVQAASSGILSSQATILVTGQTGGASSIEDSSYISVLAMGRV